MPSTPMWRVTQIVSGVAGSPYYLTGHFGVAGGTAQAAATAWRAFLNQGTGTLRTGMSYNTISEVSVVDPTTDEVVGIEPVSVPQIIFTSTEDPLPPATQALVRWRTNVYVGGREIRGRTSLPGWTEGQSTAGLVAPSIITALQGKVAALLADTTCEFAVYSKKNGTWIPVTAGSPWNQWAVLRSRRD